MRFVYDLIIPAATPVTTPVQRAIKLVPGRVTRILVSFRHGPHNRVFVRVRQGLYRVLPVADSDAIFGDGFEHSVSMDLELNPPEPEIILEGWAPTTRYPHTVTFSFDVSPSGGNEAQSIFDLLMRPALESEG